MEQQKHLSCARCSELENLLKTAESHQADMGEQLAGRELQLRAAGQREVALRRELETTREEDPRSKEIKGILEYWKRTTGHPRARIPLTGERAKLVRGKLRTFKVAELMEAIDGAALKPYMRFGKRYVYGNAKTEKATEIEHCIGTERRIEENRRACSAAQETAAARLEQVSEIWEHFRAMEQAYFTLVTNALCARDREAAGVDAADVLAVMDRAEAELGMVDVREAA